MQNDMDTDAREEAAATYLPNYYAHFHAEVDRGAGNTAIQYHS